MSAIDACTIQLPPFQYNNAEMHVDLLHTIVIPSRKLMAHRNNLLGIRMRIRNIVCSVALTVCMCTVCAAQETNSAPSFSLGEHIVQGDSVMYILVLSNSLDHAIAYSGWRHSHELFEDKVAIRSIRRLDNGTWREMTVRNTMTHSKRRVLKLQPGGTAKATHVANLRDTVKVGIMYWLLPPRSATESNDDFVTLRVPESPALLWCPLLSTKREMPNQTNGE